MTLYRVETNLAEVLLNSNFFLLSRDIVCRLYNITPQKLPFPIDLLRRPYNSVALPCDTVIQRPPPPRILSRLCRISKQSA